MGVLPDFLHRDFAPEISSCGPKGPQSPLKGSVQTVCVGKWGCQLFNQGHLAGKHQGMRKGQLAPLSAACMRVCLDSGSSRVQRGQGSWECIGAKPGRGVCKVWLGRIEGKEEEKSNLLTSKSCTTGTSREGGHAATKHRETEITITEATAAASAQPQS